MPKPVGNLGARLSLGLAVLSLAASGCRSTAEPPPPQTAAEPRPALRDRLRLELGAAYDEPLPATTELQRIRGPEIYEVLCSGCHGAQGLGDGPAGQRLDVAPPSLADPDVRSFFSDRARLEIVRKGVPGTPMIGWEGMLDEEELLAVVGFVHSLPPPGGDEEVP